MTQPTPAHCPPWCTADHPADELPDDQIHRSDGAQFPAVTRRRVYAEGRFRPESEAAEFHVEASSPFGTEEIWVTIAHDNGAIETTVDGIPRLQRALEDVMQQLRQ
ncbi:hypothetical protein G7067_05725 [Leucobacter insecticola]|uniref:Uncharacterized protein n=1 Tax=Leucobacter insecticola TaxID=2714934 RepID=A0A6G8FI61_9MICO|nr:hypothetical protein [Leucobacter insecticola]QIM16028.1 hypothetical protein G7067_05725 [Leucobacter insecticola]